MFLGGVGRLLRALGGGTTFSPVSLFANGEQGVWYQNSDFSTLFQDSNGVTPVTALEQPVGLRLDKSRGLVLGAELFTNADFDNSTTGWTASGGSTFTVSSGRANWSSASGSVFFFQNVSAATNKYYEMTVNVVSVTGTVRLVVNGGLGAASAPLTTGVTTVRLQNSSANGNAGLQADTAFSIVVESISIRELPGNHAFQSTPSARPVLSARYNLLTQTEDQSANAWLNYNATQQSNVGVAPNGTNTADRIVEAAGPALQSRYQANNNGLNIQYTVSVYAKADQRNVLNLSYSGVGTNNWFAATFELTGSGTVTKTGAGASGTYTSSSITSVGNGWYFCQLTGSTNQATTHYFYAGPSDTTNPTYGLYGVLSYSGNTANGVLVWGADLRVASESSALPVYQRVGAATYGTSTSVGNPDYDSTGFPPYLIYDGGDWMQTNSINFSTGATNPPLGPELVSTLVVGAVNLVAFAGSSQEPPLTIGAWYSITLTVSNFSSGNIQLGTGDQGNVANRAIIASANGTTTVVFQATSTFITYRAGPSGFVATIAVSVKQLTNSLYAPDKMSVFAGVRKLSDTQQGVVAELSANISSNNGAFLLDAPSSNTPTYRFGSKGTSLSLAETPPQYPAPITGVLTGLGDISADGCILRVNGIQIVSSLTDQGTGSYGNYPLYIGARGGVSSQFNGRDYGFVIVGRAVTASELTNTEDYMDVQTFGKNMTLVYSDELTTALGELITAADGDQIYMSVSYV